MSAIGDMFTQILLRWETEVSLGSRSQAAYEQALATYLPDWRDQDPESFRASKWYHEYGAAAAPGLAAPVVFLKLPVADQARALYRRFGGDMRAMQAAIDELELPPANLIALKNEIRFVDQAEAYTPLAKQVMDTAVRSLPRDTTFDAESVFDKKGREAFHDPATGQYYGTRRAGARRVSDLGAAIAASAGSIVTGTGEATRVALLKKAIDPTDPANIFREQKTIWGQGGFQSKVFIRRAGSETLEPLYPEPVSREDVAGNVFRQEWQQDINFVVVARRFKEESQAFALDDKYEAVVRQFQFLENVPPGAVQEQEANGARRQVPFAPGFVHDTDDYTKTKISVYSSDSTGTWVMFERSVPLAGGYARHDLGGKALIAGAGSRGALGIPADVEAQFAIDYASANKNISARWYGEVVRAIHDSLDSQGRSALLDRHGWSDLWDARRGTIRWRNLLTIDPEVEYATVEDPTRVIKGGLSRFQILALEINNDPTRYPEAPGGRGSIFLAKSAGSYTRSGAYSWRKPMANIETAARIAEEDPGLYNQMLKESRPRQEIYAEVQNVAFLNAHLPGVRSTNLKRVRDSQGRSGYVDRAVDLTAHPEIAAEIMAAATADAKGGEVGYNHLAAAISHTLVAHGYNPTDRLKFRARTGGSEQTLYLTNARAGKYFSGPHWKADFAGLADEDADPNAMAAMEKIVSRFGRTQLEVVRALSLGLTIGEGLTDRLFNAENELIAGHDFNRAMTGLSVRHSWGGPITGDSHMPLGQIAAPDSVLAEMFPELAAHPERLADLKAFIDSHDVVATATREPSPARLQTFFNLRLVTHDSVVDKLTLKRTDRLIIHPATIAQGSGDFDGDGFKTLLRSAIKWDPRAKAWVMRNTRHSMDEDTYRAQARLLEDRTYDLLTSKKGEPVGLVGMQALSEMEDLDKLAAGGGNLQLLQERDILGIGAKGEMSLAQAQAGLAWRALGKEQLGKSYNLGRRLRGLSGDDERYADLTARLDQVYVDAGRESPGLRRFMENMEGYQPATGYTRRGLPGSKLRFHRFASHNAAMLDTITAFMQMGELGNSAFVAELLVPDDNDPQTAARRKTLVEIRESGQWYRLKEVFGEDAWDNAAELGPLFQMFRGKSSGRWAKRLAADSAEPGPTPLAPMSALDYAWAELERGQAAAVSVASSRFGRASHDPALSAQENLYRTGTRLVEAYRDAEAEARMAAHIRAEISPMLGLMDESRHEVAEVLESLRAQAKLSEHGPRVRAATGGEFMVPQGYDNDDYLIGVKSGERVTVETPAQLAERAGRYRGRGSQANIHFAAGTNAYQPGYTPSPRRGKRRTYASSAQVTGSELGQDVVAATFSRLGKEKLIDDNTPESILGTQTHGMIEDLEAANAAPAGHTRFSEVGMRGTAHTGGRDISVGGTLDTLDVWQENGTWQAQIFDYKTGRPAPHDKQLAFYQWLLGSDQTTIEPGEIPLDPVSKLRARYTADLGAHKQGEEIFTSGEQLARFLSGKGLKLSDLQVVGANVIEPDAVARAALDLAEPLDVDDPRRLAAVQTAAQHMRAATLAPSLTRYQPSVATSEIPDLVGSQLAVKTQVAQSFGPVRQEVEKIRLSKPGTDEARLWDRLRLGGYGERLAAMAEVRQEAGVYNLTGRSPRHSRASGGRGTGGGFASPNNPMFQPDMEAGASLAGPVGESLMAWGQGGTLDINHMLQGVGAELEFPPEVLGAFSILDAVRAGRAGRTSWDQVRTAATTAQGFMQANLPSMPKDVQAYFQPPVFENGKLKTPPGPGYDLFQSLAVAGGETRGASRLVRTDKGVWSSEIEDITKDAPDAVKALVPVFKDLVAKGKQLQGSLDGLHNSTQGAGKAMTASQARWEKQADETLGSIENRLIDIRKTADAGVMPAAGTEAAHELGASLREAPKLALTAATMGAKGPPRGGGGFLDSLNDLFGQGGEGIFGKGGMEGFASRMLGGFKIFYLERLANLAVGTGAQAMQAFEKQNVAQTQGLYQAGLAQSYTPATANLLAWSNTRQRAMGALGNSFYATYAPLLGATAGGAGGLATSWGVNVGLPAAGIGLLAGAIGEGAVSAGGEEALLAGLANPAALPLIAGGAAILGTANWIRGQASPENAPARLAAMALGPDRAQPGQLLGKFLNPRTSYWDRLGIMGQAAGYASGAIGGGFNMAMSLLAGHPEEISNAYQLQRQIANYGQIGPGVLNGMSADSRATFLQGVSQNYFPTLSQEQASQFIPQLALRAPGLPLDVQQKLGFQFSLGTDVFAAAAAIAPSQGISPFNYKGQAGLYGAIAGMDPAKLQALSGVYSQYGTTLAQMQALGQPGDVLTPGGQLQTNFSDMVMRAPQQAQLYAQGVATNYTRLQSGLTPLLQPALATLNGIPTPAQYKQQRLAEMQTQVANQAWAQAYGSGLGTGFADYAQNASDIGNVQIANLQTQTRAARQAADLPLGPLTGLALQTPADARLEAIRTQAAVSTYDSAVAGGLSPDFAKALQAMTDRGGQGGAVAGMIASTQASRQAQGRPVMGAAQLGFFQALPPALQMQLARADQLYTQAAGQAYSGALGAGYSQDYATAIQNLVGQGTPAATFQANLIQSAMAGPGNVLSSFVSGGQMAGFSFSGQAGIPGFGADYLRTRQTGGVTGVAGAALGTTSVYNADRSMISQYRPALSALAARGGGFAGQLYNAYTNQGTPTSPSTLALGLNPIQLGAFGPNDNVGGAVAAQMVASNNSYNSSMASLGVSAAQANLSWAFQSGVGMPTYPSYPGMPASRAGVPLMSQWAIQDAQIQMGREQAAWGLDLAGARVGLSISQYNQTDAFNRQYAGTQRQFQLENFGLQGQQMQTQRAFQLQNFGLQAEQMGLSRQFQQQNWAFSQAAANTGYGFQMRDIDIAIRRSSGFERQSLVRQKEEETSAHNIDTQGRQLQMDQAHKQWAEENKQFDVQKKQASELYHLSVVQFETEKRQAAEMYRLQLARMDMEKEQFMARAALDLADIEKQRGWLAEKNKLEDATRDNERTFATGQHALQLAAIGVQAKQLTDQKIYADTQSAIDLRNQAQEETLGFLFQTSFAWVTNMSTWMSELAQQAQDGQSHVTPPNTDLPGSDHAGEHYIPGVGWVKNSSNATGASLRQISGAEMLDVGEAGPESLFVSVSPFALPHSRGARTAGAGNAGGGDTYIAVYLDGAEISKQTVKRIAAETYRGRKR